MAPLLHIDHVAKRFGSKQALRDLNLEIGSGSLFVLLGPAGAGKTTTLRIAAGLEAPSEGRVLLDGLDVTRRQPNQRNLAMIFDNLALYPNLTGYENIAFPLRVAGLDQRAVDGKVREISELLRIGHILDRLPSTFSGGERQRIALGRAMVREPVLYLLDEPLSSLDAMLRLELRSELKRLQRDMGKTFLFTTPDFTEALALGDQVCVLLDGSVRQIASAQEIYDSPVDSEVATFVGNPPMNIWRGERERVDGQLGIRLGSMLLRVPPRAEQTLEGHHGRLDVGLRPEHVFLPDSESGRNGDRSQVRIVDVEPLGMHTTLTLDVGGVSLRANVSGDHEYEEGQVVDVSLAGDRLHFFDGETGRRL